MLQHRNDTPFAVGMAALPDIEGVDTLQVVVQGTYALTPALEIAAEQELLVGTDRNREGGEELERLGAFVVDKVGTDVFLTGHAHAPDGRPTERSAVSVRVADRRAVVAVHGDRTWRSGGRLSRAQPFTRMPLCWTRAFGGSSPGGRARDLEAAQRNPVGVGLDSRPGQRLPNLEHPGQPITSPSDRPPPACFAPIAPSWSPRVRHGGTYDAAWVRRRAPRLPNDFDPRFFTAAVEALAFDRPLQGGEPVAIVGVRPRGAVEFEIPSVNLHVDVYAGGRWDDPLRPTLDSVHLLPDEDRVVLTWRCAVSADRRLLRIEGVNVGWRPTKAAA